MPIDKDLTSVQQARDLVAAAYSAQKIFATFSQERVDSIVEGAAQAALAQKDRLGQLAVEETGYGVPKDKAEKNRFAAQDVPKFFRTLKTVGIINETENIVEIADPRGVVAAIIPSTNPTSTAIFKILIALKSRNGIVLSPHPSANQCINETVRVMREAAEAAGAPVGLIGCLSVSTLQGTEELMKHKQTAVILATGGIGLVKAAYSSGKPAFGVGPGNVPVLIERSAEVAKAVADILASKTFDYGTICASEQAVVVESIIDKSVRAEFTAQGGYFCNPSEKAKLEKLIVLPTRGLNPQIVGKSPQVIAQLAGFSVPAEVRALIVELTGVGRDHPLSLEKLSPVLAYYVVENWQAGSEICQQVLRYGGMGHTIGIHSQNRDIIRQFGIQQPASRIIANSPTTQGAIGLSTNLSPSMTLGCGSWGGNVTSDNISPIHLMDIKRIAFETRPITRALRLPAVNKAVIANNELAMRIAAEVVEQVRARTSNATAKKEAATPKSGEQTTLETKAASEPAPLSNDLISKLVNRFLAERQHAPKVVPTPPANPLPPSEVKPAQPEPTPTTDTISKQLEAPKVELAKEPEKKAPPTPRPVDFVCEADVYQALRDRQKIYIGAKTIITPSAKDLGEAREIFAKS